jgi:hypothetical protein
VTQAFRRVWFTLLAGLTGMFLILALIEYLSPFDLEQPPGYLTKLHLQLLKRDPERCFEALTRNKVDFRRAQPEKRENGCGYDDAAHLMNSGVRYGSNIMLRCPAMLGVLLWERHVVQTAAQEHFGKKITAIRHAGTYACRNINREKFGRLSEHAFANAIDISAFTLADGTAISIRDWKDQGAKGRFLRAVRNGACRIFGTVLSPEHDAAHSTHFHIDMRLADVCR